MKRNPRIENWSVRAIGDEYTAPEAMRTVLVGEVYEDIRAADGTLVQTSSLEEIDAEAGWAQTKNTRYRLGKVSPEFQSYLDQNGYKLSDYVMREKRDA